MTITEFLLERIAEDEERASSGWSRLGDMRWETTNEGQDFLTPSAVLAECSAKRAILGTYRAVAANGNIEGSVQWHEERALLTSIRALATVYADHPDYRQEWAA